MLITISFQDAVATPVIRRQAQKLSGDVARYFRQVLSVDWHFHTERHLCLAKLKLHARVGFFRAAGQGTSFRAAMGEAAEKLLRQRREKKEIQSRARRRKRAKAE